MKPVEFLTKAVAAAKEAGHIWPEYAACEAALESGWGESAIARRGNNLFGQKTGFSTQDLPVLDMPTKENVDLDHDGVVEPDEVIKLKKCGWAMFSDWATCFRERMELLQRSHYYKDALAAKTGEEFVKRVSKIWATDPERGAKVLATYRSHFKNGGIV